MHQWIGRFIAQCVIASSLIVSSVAHATAAGSTPGSFAVTPVGAAAYTIPIWAPPGPNHLQPNIALTYNSGQGNGYIGVGWTLSGLSAINRCNRTVAQDGTASAVALATTDAICLDGQRLQLTGGTIGTAGSTYQTEIATFQNVTAYGSAGNGPAYFIVQAPNGVKYEYGNTTSSQVLATGSSTALSWLLDKVTDPAGNTMTVSYNAATGTAVPATISWTPTTAGATSYSYTMTFGYGTNAAQSSIYGYVAGTTVINTQLLNSIAVAYSGTIVKKYNLSYTSSAATGREELTQVQECADATQNNCLAPSAIGYQSGTGVVGIASATTGTGSSSSAVYARTADINGDGLQDIIYATKSGTTLTWWVQFATSAGFGAPINTGATTNSALATAQPLIDDFLGTGANQLLAPVGTVWYSYQWNGTSFTATSTGITVDTAASGASPFATADINGDGKADLAALDLTSGTYYVVTRLNTSSGSTVSFSSTTTSTSTGIASSNSVDMGMYGNNQITNTPVRHFDWNGNGLHGLMLNYGLIVNEGKLGNKDFFYTKALASNGSGGFTTSSSWVSASQAYSLPTPINWNDDACTDLYYQGSILVSACNGASQSTIVLNSSATGMESVVAVDWAGHRRRDILANFGGGTTLTDYASTGSGFAAGVSTSLSAAAYIVFDQNGDGLDDLLTVNAGTSGLLYGLHNGSGLPPDLANSFTDGYGVNASPSYVSIARGNYTAMTTAVYPNLNYSGPFYVVSQFSATSPASTGGTYTKSYTYTGAQLNTQGRGFMGFTTQQAIDSRTSIAETVTYNLTFPTVGLVLTDTTIQNGGSGATIVSSSGIPTVTTLSSTPGAQRFFPYLSSQTMNKYEVGGTENGQLITTALTNFTFDSYGNITQITNTVTDKDSGSPYNGQSWTTATANTTSVDTSHWCLNLFSQVQTVYSASNGSTGVTRTKGLTPDTTNCRYTQVVTEPSSSAYKVTEAFGFDSFGNINSDAVTGFGMASRTTTANWGTTGQFPISVTDPTGATTGTTTYNYNFSYGKISSVTTPNGITTSWQYTDGFGRKTQETRPDGTYTQWQYVDCAAGAGCIVGSHGTYDNYTVYGSNASVIRQGTLFHDLLGRSIASTTELISGWSRNEVRYDSLSRISQQSMPCTWSNPATACTYWATLSYDSLNRPTQVQRPISASNSTLQTSTFQYTGRTTVITDPQGKTRTLITDVNGWARQTKDAVGYAVITAYDAAGSPTGVTDSSGNSLWYNATYAYGVAPFLLNATDMDMGAWSFTVDALGEPTSWKDAKGQSFSETYDLLGRPLSRTEPDLFTQWTWGSSASSHNIGQMQSVCTGTGTSCASTGYSETAAYDSVGRQSQRVITIPSYGTFTYTRTYNATTGLLNTLTYPVSTSGYALQLQYGYQNGLLQSVSDVSDTPNVTVWTANTQNPATQITKETLGNGIVTNRSFDAVTGWLSSVQSGIGSGAAVQNQSFLYDEMGNLTQRQDGNRGLTENAYYDADYRLTSTNLNGTQDFSVSYDATGNITSRSDIGAGAAWTYDPVHKHQATNIAGIGLTYVYDANGNVTTRGGSPITWSSYNYPTAITVASQAGSETVALSYGPDRSRWQQQYSSVGFQNASTTNYIGGLLEQVNSGGITTWRHYIYAGSEPVAVYARTSSGTNTFNYFLSDHQGSVADITSSNGSTVVAESNTPFGVRRNPSTWGDPAVTATGWTGQVSNADMDASQAVTQQGYTFQTGLGEFMGLNHMNGRVQDAITGRFLSADPTIPDPSYAQSYNRYSYVNNNPLSFSDPTGFDELSDDDDDNGGGGGGGGGLIGGTFGAGAGSGVISSSTPYITPLTGTMIPGYVPDGFSCSGDCSLSALTGLSQGQIDQILGGSSPVGIQGGSSSSPSSPEGNSTAGMSLTSQSGAGPADALAQESSQNDQQALTEVTVTASQSQQSDLPEVIVVGYNGYFHNATVRTLADDLRAKGVSVATGPTICLRDVSPCARPDLVFRDPVTGILQVLEVKTGDNYSFTAGQSLVFPHLDAPNTLVSASPQLTQFGILPGGTLPPMAGWVWVQLNANTPHEILPMKAFFP